MAAEFSSRPLTTEEARALRRRDRLGSWGRCGISGRATLFCSKSVRRAAAMRHSGGE